MGPCHCGGNPTLALQPLPLKEGESNRNYKSKETALFVMTPSVVDEQQFLSLGDEYRSTEGTVHTSAIPCRSAVSGSPQPGRGHGHENPAT